jgi:hypothetical protein
MTDRGETPPAGADVDPALSELTEEITRRLLSGEAVDLEAYAGRHPGFAGSIRDLLPTMHELAALGRSFARARGHSPPPPRKNSLP